MTVTRILVECEGVLDAHSAEIVKRDTLPLIDGESDVVIDLSNVEFIDSIGLGVLVNLYKAARLKGCNANFIGVAPNVRRVLEIIRLDQIFDVHPDLESAARALDQRR